MNRFPDGFLWGAATAAYQVEGGARDDGRGASIWDTYCAVPGRVHGGDTGDVACDHYHLYRQDVRLMKEMGLASYRFSIAWPRIFPDGAGRPNRKGVDFYDSLIDELLRAGIDPMATLYHWDLPQALQDKGGWDGRDTVDRFADYSQYAFARFGDRVTKWITLNEPWVVAFVGNYIGRHAPGLTDLSVAVQVSHHLHLAHAKAVERYRNCARAGGEIGIALNLYPMYPASESEADKEASERADEYHNRWFLDPVLRGEYPRRLWEEFAAGLNAPAIGAEDMRTIAANRCDFLGINYYFRRVIRAAGVHRILRYEEVKPRESRYTDMDWEIYPEGLFDLLRDIKTAYDNPPVYITENGAAFRDRPDGDGMVDDAERIAFLKSHIEQAHRAIEDGVKLRGYYVWSLMDNFEWGHGYNKRFGLVRVDYGTLARIWKKSAFWYRDIVANNGARPYAPERP